MTTLISVHNSDGCVGRCDAKCYNARGKICHCVCQGKNHGALEAQAKENARKYADDWIELYRVEHPHEELEFRILDQQLELALP